MNSHSIDQQELAIINQALKNSNRVPSQNSVKSIEEFKLTYNLTTYASYITQISHHFEHGTGFINERVIYWALTSGTTSGPKYIPITENFLNTYMQAVAPLFSSIASVFGSEVLANNAILPLIGKYKYNISPTGVTVGCISGLIFNMAESKLGPYLSLDISRSEAMTFDQRWHYINEKAKAKSIRCIMTANPAFIIELIRQNSENKSVNPIDANLLWPDLKLIICQTGSTCASYVHILKELFPHVQIWDGGIGGSEGYYATTQLVDEPIGKLNDSFYFFEFLPCSENITANTTVSFQEMQSGQQYELVLTTSNGFIRYNTQDIVSREGDLLRFLGRKNKVFSFAGERLTEIQLNDTFKFLAEYIGVTSVPFKFRWVADAYVFFLLDSYGLSINELSNIIDKYLQGINVNYHYARNMYKLLKAPIIEFTNISKFSTTDVYHSDGTISLIRQEKPLLEI